MVVLKGDSFSCRDLPWLLVLWNTEVHAFLKMPVLCVNNTSFNLKIQESILQDAMAADAQLVQDGTTGNS